MSIVCKGINWALQKLVVDPIGKELITLPICLILYIQYVRSTVGNILTCVEY
jgi:hypothetical protein